MSAQAPPAAAQYFGRNKIQYRTFGFEVLRTEHFDVYFYPEERAAVDQAARMAERWYARLSRVFNHQLIDRQPLILYASHPDFEQTNAIEGELGEGTGGVTEALKRRIVLPLGGPLAESDHVIGHELVHAFQFDITTLGALHPASVPQGIERLPLWFVEGMAEYLSLGPVDPNTAMWMRDAAIQEKMPAIHDLANSKYFPYRWGQSLWSYITGRWGDGVVPSLLRTAVASGNAEVALSTVLGETPADLTREWQAALRQNAAAVTQQASGLSSHGRVLERDASELPTFNVSPSLSPNGRRLMFLSQRDLLSVDLFLADGDTGKILSKVVNTAVDPHFSSIEFINSAGAWSPDSRQFVFSVVQGGRAALVLLDVDAGATRREIPFPEVGEIFNPTWSPDGGAIAFSALEGGLTDLFLYDLRTSKTRRLTQDAFADLQPAWSPDGRVLAFVTDRYTTRLADLSFGNYQVAVIDVATGQARPVDGATEGKNINPQWADDGELFFVSDRSGIANIYRVSASAGQPRQVTNVTTGVSGITSISPAISYAPGARRLAFSLYESGKYNIYAIDSAAALAGTLPVKLTGPNPAMLPPTDRKDGATVALQRNNTIGLPDVRDSRTAPYSSRLALDLVGQPYVTAGVDTHGAFVGGGTALFWSDMLGDYNLGAAVQVSSGFGGGWSDIARSTGAQVVFGNRKHRWNYGVTAGQIPFQSGELSLGITERDGSAVGIQQMTVFRQVERSVTGVAAYPFNASHRFEVAAGVSNISFDQRVQTTLFDPNTGDVISEELRTVPTFGSLNLGQFSAALVHDTAVYGATSPIAGQSYRLQVSPTIGTLRFNSVLADYRRYVMPVSFYTLAGRVIHFGRYGRDGEDRRLVPVYLGYPGLVRGYDFNSFGASECTPTASGSCQELDRLLGSRVLVANLELRFPLLRLWGVRPGMYGRLPVEVGVFADAGVAWNSGEKPTILGGQRTGVWSAGVTWRVNVLGIVVLEFDLAKPFQRKGQGWVFQFNISPGF
jgi:Tol biopolymer transport system component